MSRDIKYIVLVLDRIVSLYHLLLLVVLDDVNPVNTSMISIFDDSNLRGYISTDGDSGFGINSQHENFLGLDGIVTTSTI